MMILITILTIIVIGLWFIFWIVHIDMTKSYSLKYGYGKFSYFIREFNKREWERRRCLKSFFEIGICRGRSEIHASIIKFDNTGMLLNPIDYLRFEIWRYKQFKNIETDKKYKWQ